MSKLFLIALLLSFKSYSFESRLYASLRFQIESVNPDNTQSDFDEYIDTRDAYSRMGVQLSYDLKNDIKLMFKYEVPIDLANQKIQLPYDDEDYTRIAKIQIQGPFGTIWYGKDWLGYYNNISYAVDRFNSYYSGWGTYTSFRENNTFTYITPKLGFLKFTYSNIGNTGDGFSHRKQYVVSANLDKWSINFGLDDLNKATDQKILGFATSYQAKQWYVGLKVERFSSDEIFGGSNDYGADKSTAMNIFGQYSLNDKSNLKLMLANIQGGYGGKMIHLAYEYDYTSQLKLFIEYYSEEDTAAISERRLSSFLGSSEFNQPADSGGNAFAFGFHYDFELTNKPN